ncbi:unnamed protein product [Clonostachys rhizophaga]|uniref:Fatty acid hydroxylase domain-containing protein n=1 Tax=Clonostachys rhizophaga TaxID=160324 RepID=A0A9N9VQX9_9HYPO|nr:unnamed protein product [Clonostachys rhizophaga]
MSTIATHTSQHSPMKSTWRSANRDRWTASHWLIHALNAYPLDMDQTVPVHAKTDKIPHLSQASQQLWVFAHALVPMFMHQTWLIFTSRQGLGRFAIFSLYFFAFNATVIREVNILRRLGHLYGFFDGDQHERDGVPDTGVTKAIASLIKTSGCRMAMAVLLSYDATISPADFAGNWKSWPMLALQIGLYGIILDFWFYLYHRAVHEVPALWKFHRTHHLTKHPNPLLTAYADEEQEFIEMVVVPLMTYLTMRWVGLTLGFYQWWICHQFIVYTEVWGHSGIRVHLSPPSPFNWLLEVFRAELLVEDHDLHHRKGWRKSYNYGKQTRLWDRVFGTCADRVESVEASIDYQSVAHMPII